MCVIKIIRGNKMNEDLNKAIEILKKNNQEHVIPFLENGKNTLLINQILNINFEELERLYSITQSSSLKEIGDLKPILAVNPSKLSKDELKKIEKEGINIIKNSKFAVVTMAGGQGTRLRASKSKGNI